MDKHTPGPWFAKARSWGYPEVENGPIIPLWDIHREDGTNIAGVTIYSKNEPDAKLIAAAPDLADALRDIAVFIATAKIRPEVQMMVSNLATNALLKAGCSISAKPDVKI